MVTIAIRRNSRRVRVSAHGCDGDRSVVQVPISRDGADLVGLRALIVHLMPMLIALLAGRVVLEAYQWTFLLERESGALVGAYDGRWWC